MYSYIIVTFGEYTWETVSVLACSWADEHGGGSGHCYFGVFFGLFLGLSWLFALRFTVD